MKNICVFMGAQTGNNTQYLKKTESLGQELVRRGIHLVYGGASIGLMGALANTVMQAGGQVTGVMPRGNILPEEIMHTQLTALHLVDSMHARKHMMGSLADGFIALPGGIGTLEEFFEVWTDIKIGSHKKPLGLLNVDGYFDHLLNFLKHSVAQGFFAQKHLDLLIVESEPAILLERLIVE